MSGRTFGTDFRASMLGFRWSDAHKCYVRIGLLLQQVTGATHELASGMLLDLSQIGDAVGVPQAEPEILLDRWSLDVRLPDDLPEVSEHSRDRWAHTAIAWWQAAPDILDLIEALRHRREALLGVARPEALGRRSLIFGEDGREIRA